MSATVSNNFAPTNNIVQMSKKYNNRPQLVQGVSSQQKITEQSFNGCLLIMKSYQLLHLYIYQLLVIQ